jgi:uroporphyrinogen-III decarboxylase
MRDVITRRDLLKAALGGIATLSASNLVEGQQKTKRSKVVLIRHPDVLDKSGRINTKVLQEMLDEAIMALVGVKDPIEAWRKLVKPTDLGVCSKSLPSCVERSNQ